MDLKGCQIALQFLTAEHFILKFAETLRRA